MKHNKATDRMARLIAAIPWIVARDGALVDDISERFDYPRDLLLDDLENVVFFVGVPPYTPDTLIEVQIDDDMVWIRYADWFSRPMRLTPSESLALLAAGQMALAFDRQDDAGPLVRGLTKLRLATGAGTDVLDIQIGHSNQLLLDVLRDAREAQFCVDITYYSFGRDERTERRIEPQTLFIDSGNWYVAGHCHLADAQRVFKVDRIQNAIMTDSAMTQPRLERDGGFDLATSPRITIEIPNGRARVLDGVAVDSIVTGSRPDTSHVTLPASSNRWLEQLLIRIGPEASIVSVDPELDPQTGNVISSILHRYHPSAGEASTDLGR